ncbi:MAG: hypothetical protein QOI85_1128 [Chloroflexota bacterium]|jgi:predicted short-subunit dehydrogenase-like oxidoreductase (DUF2520 family)|nr:hypothetical protein [Chloroflexota bacterium]
MFETVHIVGTGRAGGAIRARLAERGLGVTDGRDPDPTAELVLLCVPDHVISEVAQRVPLGPWVAHVSGATQLGALHPHKRRFSVHPLQTLTRERGPEQLDGAWGAISAEADDALVRARWLAETLGFKPFEVADADRALYHAAAVIGGNYLVTLHEVAGRLLHQVGAPPEAIVPLMTRTIENGFDLTGPIARGDWSTVEAHLAVLEERAPDLVPFYRALAEATPR